jgi:hypothetical protein
MLQTADVTVVIVSLATIEQEPLKLRGNSHRESAV